MLRALVLVSFTLGAILAMPQSTSQAGQPARTVLATPIYVAGYQIRTSNAKEMSGNGEIGKLWARFMQQNLAAQIPDRVGQSLMVVYSDYASDQNGEFTYLLGAPVDSIADVPRDLTVRTIPAGAYAVLTTPAGPPQQTIPALWAKIWSMSEAELGGKRSFVMDYETYDGFADPQNMQVSVHLGLASTAE